MSITLTVFFEEPYWVGLVEWREVGEVRAARHIFGAEPLGGEVLAFVLRELAGLAGRTGPGVPAASAPARLVSPKRAARAAAEALRQRGGSTLAQEAVRLETERRKRERRTESRAAREAERERRRAIARAKARARHRGR